MGNDRSPEITRNEQAGRFELAADPDAGRLEYRRDARGLVLVHTEVADRLEGEGVGSALVREALAHAEAEQLPVVPECRFVAGWLDRHPERAAELDIVSA